MPRLHDAAFRRDLLKFACFIFTLAAAGLLFLGNPALSLPTLCAVVLTTLLSPWVATLERRGFSRSSAILILFLGFTALGASVGFMVARNWQNEWLSIQEKAPTYFSNSVGGLTRIESKIKAAYPFLKNVKMAESFSNWGSHTGSWFADQLPGMMSKLLSCIFLVPILTFCFLKEGRTIRRGFFQLVPNRFFESVYIVSHGVVGALSSYLRAKMIEGFLVGCITGLGLWAIHFPYAIVLGVWSGVTNVLPYIGPVLGAAPGIAIAALDAQGGGGGAVWMTAMVYGGANLVDSMVIFPGVVAKLVKLPPLVLVASVVVGQYYGGIIGMLVSIPIAAALKVLLSEVYVIVYGFVPDP